MTPPNDNDFFNTLIISRFFYKDITRKQMYLLHFLIVKEADGLYTVVKNRKNGETGTGLTWEQVESMCFT